MLNALKQSLNYTFTENGALAHKSSGNFCVDFFATVGALRNAPDGEVIRRFIRAFAESREYAMKTLFFARDIRGGLGERRVFRSILRFLADSEPELVFRNVPNVIEYGRFDDLLLLLGTKCESIAIDFFKSALADDCEKMAAGEPVSLLAKWLPSINTSSSKQVARAKTIAKALKMSPDVYRKTLSGLRKYIDVLERRLCEEDYTFDYGKLPSKALFNYRRAFLRHDEKRYKAFLEAVKNKTAILKTGSLYPYDIIRACSDENADENVLDITWNALEDFTDSRNALVVIDGSGSMYDAYSTVRPIDVAVSLGLYFTERNNGAFKNHFITFSENPRLVKIKGKDICEKVRYVMTFNEVANTDMMRTFALILKTAIDNNLPQQDLPETLYIISDMEFDHCLGGADLTVYETAKKLFSEYGYKLPKVVFWNVNSRREQQPVNVQETGTALVSGMSPLIFKMAMSGDMDPDSFMRLTLGGERYASVVWKVS